MNDLYPDAPRVVLYDPLAHLLGAGDGRFTYAFEDVVKLAGHACPTVAGAFLVVVQALRALYGEDMPQRGGIRITLPEALDRGVTGPVSQVFTLLTGAAGDNGFHGLGGNFRRSGLLYSESGGAGRYRFERLDTGRSVTLSYDASAIPPDPAMGPLLQTIQQGESDEETRKRFAGLWRDRVNRILRDGGRTTVILHP
jgi:hypothetical protein